MKRILPSFVAAALIHATVLTVDTRWLVRQEPIAPRTQVTTLRLVDRAPLAPRAILPLPAAPPPMPPAPKKPATKPKPVIKQRQTPKKNAPPPKAVLPSPPEPTPIVPGPAPEPEPEPVTAASTAEAKPAAPSPPLSSVNAHSPLPLREAGQRALKQSATVVQATPRYSDNPSPVYPSIARKRGYQGTTILDVFVEADGRVGDLRIRESSGHKLLDRSALKAVKRWRFVPGREAHQTVAMWVQVPVQFNLK